MASIKIQDINRLSTEDTDRVSGGGDLPNGDGRQMRGRSGGPSGRMAPKALNTEPIPSPKSKGAGKKLKI